MGPKLDGEKPPVIYIDSLVLQQISGPILFKQKSESFTLHAIQNIQNMPPCQSKTVQPQGE